MLDEIEGPSTDFAVESSLVKTVFGERLRGTLTVVHDSRIGSPSRVTPHLPTMASDMSLSESSIASELAKMIGDLGAPPSAVFRGHRW